MHTNPWMAEKEMRQRTGEILHIAEQEQLARQASPSRGGGIFAFLRSLMARIAGLPGEPRRDEKGARAAKKLQPSR